MSIIARTRIWNFFQSLFENELNEESEKAEQPEWIKTPMLDHQKSALAAALYIEKSKEGIDVDKVSGEDYGGTLFSNYGIIGDRVGSGKSLIALSLIKQPPPSDTFTQYITRMNTRGYADSSLGVLRKRQQTVSVIGSVLRPVRTALIIVPHPIVGQWEDYVANDSSLKVLFLKKRKDVTDTALFAKIEEFDAVVITSTMWRDYETTHAIHTILWSRVIVDEADSISTSITPEHINACFFWLITASWMKLVFSGGGFFNMNTYAPPESFSSYVINRIKSYMVGDYMNIEGVRNTFVRKLCGDCQVNGYSYNVMNAAFFQASRLIVHSSENYIRKSFDIPNIHHRRVLCKTPHNVRVLNDMISSSMMERLHAGDTTGVLEMLGMTTKSTVDITDAVTDSIRKELENTTKLYEFKKSIDYATPQAKQKSLEQLEVKISRLQSRIEAIVSRLKNLEDQSCPICFSPVTAPSITPCCRNLFCFGCICEVLKHRCICPLCRETIHDIQSVQVIADKSESDPQKSDIHTPKTKQETFRAFMANNPTAKVLMFSSYDASFSDLSNVLETDGISHATLNGSSTRITRLIRDFEKGKYRVLFLNARNMGAGLNINPATHVILYHRMSIETQNQIIGRAVRLGRDTPLTVVHLLHGNEMDNINTEDLPEGETIEHV